MQVSFAFQIDLWQKYIAWERSNPLRVEDQALITRRVMFAYEQCLLCLGHHANIWYEAALFLQESSRLLAEKGVRYRIRVSPPESGGEHNPAVSGGIKGTI
jgi:cleavage stimulation factor subunit 3